MLRFREERSQYTFESPTHTELRLTQPLTHVQGRLFTVYGALGKAPHTGELILTATFTHISS